VFAGTSAIQFGQSGAFAGKTALAGTSAVLFGQSGALAGKTTLAGITAIQFGQSGAFVAGAAPAVNFVGIIPIQFGQSVPLSRARGSPGRFRSNSNRQPLSLPQEPCPSAEASPSSQVEKEIIMPTARVIDLSHHNSIPKDLTAAKAAGIIGCIHKLTEGSSYTDDHADARHYLATSAGMAWGLYHFLRPGNMEQQAEFFWDTGVRQGLIDDATLLAADHEDDNVPYDDLIEFCEVLEELSNRVPVIYSGHLIKDQCIADPYPDKYRLWLAHYASSPTLPNGCEKYYLWQFSDKGTVAGITPPTDVNAIQEGITDAEFLSMWSGGEAVPPVTVPPPVASSETTITITVKGPPGTVVVVDKEEL
jgi:GH25 family lysozyme M1 (1,4-beta-N-acetylmuramidase)